MSEYERLRPDTFDRLDQLEHEGLLHRKPDRRPLWAVEVNGARLYTRHTKSAAVRMARRHLGQEVKLRRI